MQRLTEDGCLVAAHAGRFDLAGIGLALGAALLQSPDEPLRQRGELLCRHDLDDRVCMQLLARSLAEERVVLVLDDFEQNLQPGGGAFLDPSVAVYLRMLLDNARRGRLLITRRASSCCACLR
jgi:hypothetical protein